MTKLFIFSTYRNHLEVGDTATFWKSRYTLGKPKKNFTRLHTENNSEVVLLLICSQGRRYVGPSKAPELPKVPKCPNFLNPHQNVTPSIILHTGGMRTEAAFVRPELTTSDRDGCSSKFLASQSMRAHTHTQEGACY